MGEKKIMVVPVGLEKSRVLYGSRLYAVNFVYLLHNPIEENINEKKNLQSGILRYSQKFAQDAQKNMHDKFVQINPMAADLGHFDSCIGCLKDIFTKELNADDACQFYLNISTASKAFAIAAYLVACLYPNNSKVFYLRSKNYIFLDYLDDDNAKMEELRERFLSEGLTTEPYEVEEYQIGRASCRERV